MNQDLNDIPTNGFVPEENDFSAEFGNDYFQETKFQHFVRTKGVYVAMACTMLGLFAGIPILIWFSNFIIINVGSIFVLIFILGAIGLLQWKYLRNHIDMEYRHYAMFAFTGFAMFMINIILLLNYTVKIAEHSETYKIEWVYNDNNKSEISIAGLDYRMEAKVNNFLSDGNKKIPEQPKTITIVFDKGLFGFDMIGDCMFN
ncbi:MAG: hypothetical protein A3F72_20810 [Bacteroidetes bacterium RIFCSPLOWO2_12_FULL_35_15]|nr:MAG: hypothetical protein A3F72_20810 [Bacteroidetes bacterium RIFCSPLOWO2_12_FULL_35_15]